MKFIVALFLIFMISSCDSDKEILRKADKIREKNKQIEKLNASEKKFFSKDSGGDIYYQTIEIDGCEYIVLSGYSSYGYSWRSIAHKGNCKYCKGVK